MDNVFSVRALISALCAAVTPELQIETFGLNAVCTHLGESLSRAACRPEHVCGVRRQHELLKPIP